MVPSLMFLILQRARRPKDRVPSWGLHLAILGMAGLLLATGVNSTGAEFQAGVARVKITPPTPFWLSGYGSRSRPAETVRSDLWAKALALEAKDGGRWVLVTTDLIGLPRSVSDPVVARVGASRGLPRASVVLNSSHTHSGPAVWPNLKVMFDLNPGFAFLFTFFVRALIGRLNFLTMPSMRFSAAVYAWASFCFEEPSFTWTLQTTFITWSM